MRAFKVLGGPGGYLVIARIMGGTLTIDRAGPRGWCRRTFGGVWPGVGA